jgi:serine/threonine protein kinase
MVKGEERWPSYALPRGTKVNGYLIERILGSGGFGITYLAFDLLRQPFAIKEYFPRQFASRDDLAVVAGSTEDAPLFEECRDRFMREAEALVTLGRLAGLTAGIVRVYTFFEAHNTCYLVMDYIKGTNLKSVLQREPGGLAAPRVQSLMAQLLCSIRVVHQAGLMHRDVKPANIILREDDSLVLIDFGSSRPAALGDFTSYTKIYSGGYAPPEQTLGLDQGEFSDIYAIGAVCYRAIGGDLVDSVARHNAISAGLADPQPSAMQIGEGRYPKALLAAIDAALRTEASRRPQNVNAMLALLDRNERPKARTAPPLRRRNLWAAAAGGGALALTGVVAYLLLPSSLPAASKQDVVAGTLGDGTTTLRAAMPQDEVRGTPQEASGDAARPPTAEHDQPQIALGSEPLQSPPVEQPKREAGVPPRESQRIKGAADASLVDGWPIIDGKTVRLSGVDMIAPNMVDQVDHWIKAHGRYLECDFSKASTYRCLTTQKLDVAQVLLLNGVARASPDAEPIYREAEKQAQEAGRGLWH